MQLAPWLDGSASSLVAFRDMLQTCKQLRALAKQELIEVADLMSAMQGCSALHRRRQFPTLDLGNALGRLLERVAEQQHAATGLHGRRALSCLLLLLTLGRKRANGNDVVLNIGSSAPQVRRLSHSSYLRHC